MRDVPRGPTPEEAAWEAILPHIADRWPRHRSRRCHRLPGRVRPHGWRHPQLPHRLLRRHPHHRPADGRAPSPPPARPASTSTSSPPPHATAPSLCSSRLGPTCPHRPHRLQPQQHLDPRLRPALHLRRRLPRDRRPRLQPPPAIDDLPHRLRCRGATPLQRSRSSTAAATTTCPSASGHAIRLIVNENPDTQRVADPRLWQQYQNLTTTLHTPFPTIFDSTQHIDMWMLVMPTTR